MPRARAFYSACLRLKVTMNGHIIITGCYLSCSKPLAKLAKLNPKPIKMLLQYIQDLSYLAI